MYTAPYEVIEEELNRRVPLSIARWHLHTNLCLPPDAEGDDEDLVGPRMRSSGYWVRSLLRRHAERRAEDLCIMFLGGWCMCIRTRRTRRRYGRAGMDDEHGMQHDAMPQGMPME